MMQTEYTQKPISSPRPTEHSQSWYDWQPIRLATNPLVCNTPLVVHDIDIDSIGSGPEDSGSSSDDEIDAGLENQNIPCAQQRSYLEALHRQQTSNSGIHAQQAGHISDLFAQNGWTVKKSKKKRAGRAI